MGFNGDPEHQSNADPDDLAAGGYKKMSSILAEQ